MLDRYLRPMKERLLEPAARAVGTRVHPIVVTAAGFAIGVGAAWAAMHGEWGAALALWLLNRLLDGFDGTLARTQSRQTDRGAYLDIVLDFVVYAIIPIAVLLHAPSITLAVAAAAMLASFYVNAASWMYLSALLERRGAGARARGELTSVTMPDGLIGGSETVVLYGLFLLLPGRAALLFTVTTLLVAVTVVQRMMWAWGELGSASEG